jgi:uncharacterized membrane protein
MQKDHVHEHVELIARHEEESLAGRTRSERLGDKIATIAGSLVFVGFHLLIFVSWIALNSAIGSPLLHFDAFPFPFLGVLLALEAILLSSFILMRQGRVSRRSDERDHLMLQILLLTEKEVTANLKLNRQLLDRLGVANEIPDAELKDLSRNVSINNLAKTISERLPFE